MEKVTCNQAKQLDLVDYLASLGYNPEKVKKDDYWYLSPFRQERTASFKINRRRNIWYDHGIGKGGDLIKFGTLYFGCSIADLFQRLSFYKPGQAFSFHPPVISPHQHPQTVSEAGEKKDEDGGKIVVLDTGPLRSSVLIQYLDKRCIPPEIASRFCKEVDFLLYGKKYTAIGFQNNAGGYELRNENFKGSSSPKDITFIDNHTEQIAVFEGFFSFLSFQTINRNQQAPLSNYLVLNSLSFLEKSRPLIERHKHIHLVLDRDTAGRKHTRQALEWNKEKYIDRSDFYEGHKDLNDWRIHHQHSRKQSQRPGKSL